MSLSFSRILVLGALSAAITFAASNGVGGQATFHLPVEAHWGAVVLEAGDYSMSLPDRSLGQQAFVVRGVQSVFVLPVVTNTEKASDANYLRLEKVNGTYFISEYQAGIDGKAYEFAVPKTARHPAMADGTGTLVAVTNSSLRK